MTKDEALEMAIEMLEKLSYEYGQLLDGDQDYGLLPSEINADIIKTYYVKRTCQEALEQPAQEPVAWMDSEGRFRLDFKTEIVRSISAVNKEIPLYTHPAPSWQGLSNDMVLAIGEKCEEKNRGILNWIDFYNGIENMLKDKNS